MKKQALEQLIKETKKNLTAEINNRDTEAAHANADDILCDLLIYLGYKEIVDLYNKIKKWYA